MSNRNSPMEKLKRHHQAKRWAVKQRMRAKGWSEDQIDALLERMRVEHQAERDLVRNRGAA